MTEPSGMSETEHQPTYKTGDRVRISKSDGPLKDRVIGKTGEIHAIDEGCWAWVKFDTPVYTRAGSQNFEGIWMLLEELEAVQ